MYNKKLQGTHQASPFFAQRAKAAKKSGQLAVPMNLALGTANIDLIQSINR